MKLKSLSIIALAFWPTPALASGQLAEPELNACSTVAGITKCEVKCVRELGEQCLVTHVNFEGQGLKPGTELWRARFLTCLKADVDLQIKSLVLELENIDAATGPGIVSANGISTAGTSATRADRAVIFDTGKTEARISRIPFQAFLNSGDSHMEASLKLEQCGADDSSNSCRISGKFVAVTNPNIRCDFHDTRQSGAFRPPDLQTSTSLTDGPRPVGRIGQ
ncbi:MAG: hypothetical protein AAGA76_09260 [Pseudomonadota bacterium]